MENGKWKMSVGNFAVLRSLFFVVLFCVSIVNFSCRSSVPTDLRTLAPADTLVYLETNDLGKMLAALTENKAFEELAANKTDFTAVEGVEFAVAVTGFETSEQQIADEQSILNFKPHFVAVADTHAWNRTAVSIAETEIGKLARKIYGDAVKLEKSERADAQFFVWTSGGGRKIFSAVAGSVIYVGNDKSVLDQCLEIRRGTAESLSKNENLARARQSANGEGTNKIDENRIAFGYVSSEGVAQIGNLAGVSTAIGATENDDARGFIARVLPQIFQKTIEEISWTATKTARGIEDEILIFTNGETASVFNETMQISASRQTDSFEFLPFDVLSATAYKLQNPQLSWRSLLFVAAKQTSAADARILAQFSDSLLEPYGITDAEMFLSAIDSDILTAQFDGEGEKSAAIFTVKGVETIKKAIAEINFKSPPENYANARIWKSDDGEIVAAFAENKLILGDGESVLKCLEAKRSGRNYTKNQYFQMFGETKSVAATVGKDADSAEKIVEVLSGATKENKKITTIYFTETRFTEKGIERRSVSAFGLIGTILEQVKNQ